MIESTEQSELATDSGDYSDEAAMDLLAKRREQPAQEAQEAPPEVEDEEAEVEGEGAPENDAEEASEDDDPEIDLGDIKLKRSELKAGYMKDADYRRKTADAAEAKRAAQVVTEQVQAERSHYANHLDVILERLQTQLIGSQEHLAELARTDPAEWVAQNAIQQQRYADLQAAYKERQLLANRISEEQEQELSDWRKAEKTALSEKLPEWSDPKVQERESLEIAEYLISKGYPHEELANLQDHRALLIARDAAKWQQHIKAKASAQAKQVKSEPPKAIKAGAQRPANQPNQNAYEDVRNRLKSSGSDDDAMRLLQLKRQR